MLQLLGLAHKRLAALVKKNTRIVLYFAPGVYFLRKIEKGESKLISA
jgi:hypothetical protein